MSLPSGFKPMLACDADKCGELKFPMLVSPKLDGIRAISWNGVLYSRSLTPIRNTQVQQRFKHLPSGLDGELMVGAQHAPDAMTRAQSVIMSMDKSADEVTFNVFDFFMKPATPFHERLSVAEAYADGYAGLVAVHHELANEQRVQQLEEEYLQLGYEGAMLRHPNLSYKYGRSTPREGGLIKLKRFKDSEAVVVGFLPRMHNANEQTRDALGRSKRSSSKTGLVETDTLGTLLVRDVHSGQEFGIGTGLNDAQRAEMWGRRNQLVGKIVKYKFFPTGTVSAPRFPVFIGFRDSADMGV